MLNLYISKKQEFRLIWKLTREEVATKLHQKFELYFH